jgi:ribosomal peptide maturation radical SAM protein 1
MRILLVNMPWQSLDSPSLAVGVLHARLASVRPQHEVHDLYANVRWADHLLGRGVAEPTDYMRISEGGFFHDLGDWVFASALYDTEVWRADEYASYLRRWGIEPDLAVRLQPLSGPFVRALAEEVAAGDWDLVGFTTTFMQNVPALALARQVKRLRPECRIVFGGGNCDGVQGAALHRNFRWVDYVVRGEGEQSFVELLDALESGSEPESVEGLCWWREGRSVANPERRLPFPAERIPEPVYEAYFEELGRSGVGEYVDPKIVLESARGCWWGEKHHCTFCGLNGSMMKFRSKGPERVFQEIESTSRRYQSLDVIMVDNIMDMGYFRTLVPMLQEASWDLRFHYEIKSNLRREQVEALRDAGIVHVQPGIESLSSSVLRIMRKGVTGTQNVRLLRDAEDSCLEVAWNILYGFPGEREEDYERVLEQLPNLWHLQPPASVSRIALERFSPNFDDPSLGFRERRPAECYRMIYELPESEVEELVYLFECTPAGIGEDVQERVHEAVRQWKRAYVGSQLTCSVLGDRLVLSDRREGRAPVDVRLERTWQVRAYRELSNCLTADGLARRLQEAGHQVGSGQLEDWLMEMRARGFVFEEDGHYVALATSTVSRRLPVASDPSLALV